MAPRRQSTLEVIIQDRSRMYRESLRILIEAMSVCEVVDVAADGNSLESVFRAKPSAAVLFEAVDVPWNVGNMVRCLKEVRPELTLVGSYPDLHRHYEVIQGITYVNRTWPCRRLLGALTGEQCETDNEPQFGRDVRETSLVNLTRRELQILALISGGFTTSRISSRLGISSKTVESRRQTLFAKLGVQNQSHAVAVAMRTGLLGAGSGQTRSS